MTRSRDSNPLEPVVLALRRAARPLQLPGLGERQVITATDSHRIADEMGLPRWRTDAVAISRGLIPLPYLKNLAGHGEQGQVRLLEASVGVMGREGAVARCLEQLSTLGVGRVTLLLPEDSRGLNILGAARAQAALAAARGRNGSGDLETRTVNLKAGNPAEALEGLFAVAACLDSALEEQLLQFACRVRRVPCVLAGVEAERAQCTTVFPGEPGTALVYRPQHPHLSSDRTDEPAGERPLVVAGSWMAEQLAGILLERPDLLRNRLLFADIAEGELGEYPLG